MADSRQDRAYRRAPTCLQRLVDELPRGAVIRSRSAGSMGWVAEVMVQRHAIRVVYDRGILEGFLGDEHLGVAPEDDVSGLADAIAQRTRNANA